MPSNFSIRFKALFSRSPKESSHKPSYEASPTFPTDHKHRRQRSATVSSAYAAEVAAFDAVDWMMTASPTATLTESDTAPRHASVGGNTSTPTKKRRPSSMFSFISPERRADHATYKADRRRSTSSSFNSLTFVHLPIIPGPLFMI